MPPQTRVCPDGELRPYADQQLCLRDAADSLRYFEYRCADAIAAGDTADTDRWIAAAQALRPGDTVFCHNSAARCHNRSLERPDEAPCPWLLRADSLFRSAYGRPGAEYVRALRRAACAGADEAPASLQVSGLVLDQRSGQPLSDAEVQAEGPRPCSACAPPRPATSALNCASRPTLPLQKRQTGAPP